MIMGFNSDVQIREELYHVQTEDLDHKRLFRTVVFRKGEVLESVESRYDDLVDMGPGEIRKRLVAQHRSVVRRILSGELGSGSSPAAGTAERQNLVVTELGDSYAGQRASFLILLKSEPSNRPISNAALAAIFPAGDPEAKVIYEAETDSRGFHLAEFRIPPSSDRDVSLLIRGSSSMGVSHVTFPILLPGRYHQVSAATPEKEGTRPNLVVSELGEPRAGDRASLLILLRSEPTFEPIPGTEIRVFFSAGGKEFRKIYEGSTDGKGFHLAEFRIPGSSNPQTLLRIEAHPEIGPVRVEVPVLEAFLASG